MIIRKKFVSEYYVSKIPNLSWDAVGDNTFSSYQLSKYCCISLADDQKEIRIWIFCKQNSPDICDFIQGLKISRVVPESTVRFAFGIRSFTIDNFTFFGANYLKYSLWKIISCGYNIKHKTCSCIVIGRIPEIYFHLQISNHLDAWSKNLNFTFLLFCLFITNTCIR